MPPIAHKIYPPVPSVENFAPIDGSPNQVWLSLVIPLGTVDNMKSYTYWIALFTYIKTLKNLGKLI